MSLSAWSGIQISVTAENLPCNQITVDNIIERSHIKQACGYLAITIILQLGATL